MSATAVMPCSCTQRYQDARLGPGMRVHNECKPPSVGSQRWRCTACGRDVTRNAPKEDAT